MGPDYPPQRGFVLLFLGMGIFCIVAGLLGFYYWLTYDVWRPYLGQIAGIALVISIPVTYLVWGYYEQRRGS